MPTPSDSTLRLNPSSVVQDNSVRTSCPEPERLPSWREELESAALTERDPATPENALSSGVASPQPALMRADDAIVRAESDPLKVEMETTSASPSNMSRSENEPATGRMSSPTGRSSSSAPTAAPSPSTASLLSYEFSNIRVCDIHSSRLSQLTIPAPSQL